MTTLNDRHSANDHAGVPVVGPMRGRGKRNAVRLMAYNKQDIARILPAIDFGSTIAEQDTLLETARVDTSVFSDLFHDKIDLIPGTKGSGKSALYRIFVDFLSATLLSHKKVVVAHGVQQFGDNVFLIYKEHFDKLSEEDFVSFWCIYLVSLAHEQFVKQPKFAQYLHDCGKEIAEFKAACQRSSIPDIKTPQTLSGIIGWVLSILKVWRPKISYQPPFPDAGTYTVDLFGNPLEPQAEKAGDDAPPIPRYVEDVKISLEAILKKSGLALWLMIDRLDEIFPRRSKLETRALRGLLRTLRAFQSQEIRVKVFLRDDIFEQVVRGGGGFTALTHVTARKSDTLRWDEDQILTMIVRRLFATQTVRDFVGVDQDKLNASRDYREECFYKVFPRTVHTGKRQSDTLRWIYNHSADGRGVVTPRDIIELLTRARQFQQSECNDDASGQADWVIGPAAIQYGLRELSKIKRINLLEAEFPHLWPHISKFVGGKTEYSEERLKSLLGHDWKAISEDLVSIGLLTKTTSGGRAMFKVPFLYRDGLELTQGKAL